MTKISIYSKDVDVRGNDRWIGSDAQNQNRTKNFTPDNVAVYFNENQVIDLGVELRYFYDTLDPLQQRVYGSITFETEIGPQVNFSAISTFILSKYTMGHTDVSQFLDFLIGSNVLLSRANNINMFGYYKIDNIEPYLPDPNFFVVTLTFDAGNGYMKEDEDYFISLVQFEQTVPSTPTLQTVTDEGNVTTNSMILENYNATYTTTLQSNEINVDYTDTFQHAYSEINVFEISANYTNPDNIFSFGKLSSSGYLELAIDNKIGTLNVEDLTNSITLKFPNKPLGSYTIATTEDFPTPTLQSVTIDGDTTTTTVYLNGGAISESINEQAVFAPAQLSTVNLNSGSGASLDSTGKLALSPDGLVSTLFASDNITQSITLQAPNKAPGSYTLATTDDILAAQLVALPFTTDHLTATNNPYVIGDVVWYLGNVYRCIANNDSIIPTATAYWTNLGAGYPLVQQPTDWSSTSGNNQILNKPTIPVVTGFVPYTGATTNVDLGEYELKAGQLSLDVSPTGTAAVGTTRWNDSIGSSETTLKGGTVILKNGVDLVARVVNKVTPNATLTRATYHAVRVSGAQGQRLAVAYAQANSDNNSADTIGLVCEDIATNQEGFIITVGQLEEINTTGSLQGETWADGDVLYLSPTTAGHITNIKPNGATGHIVVMGYVEYAHAIHGKIYVKIMNGWELDELHNCYINSPINRDVLAYNSSTDLWENKSFRQQSIGGAQFFTDFISAGVATPYLIASSAGAGATTTKSTTTAAPNQTVNQIGICQYQTGTTATGWAAHTNDTQGALAFTFGGGSWVYETFIEVDTLSTLTEQFRFITGFATQSSVANEVNAIIFTYDSGGTRNGTISSPNWQCVTSDNSTRTLTTTSVAVTTTWTKLRIEINAAATSVTFYVNDSLVATHITNIPTFANSRFLIMKQQIVKTAGTTNRSVYCDYLLYENNLTTLR